MSGDQQPEQRSFPSIPDGTTYEEIVNGIGLDLYGPIGNLESGLSILREQCAGKVDEETLNLIMMLHRQAQLSRQMVNAIRDWIKKKEGLDNLP